MSNPFCSPISGLNIHRIRTDEQVFPEAKAPDDIITEIIKIYLRHNRERISQKHLEHQEVGNFRWNPKAHHHFQLKFHTFSKTTLIPLGELLGDIQGDSQKFSETSFYFVIFFYRAVKTAKIASESSKVKRCWDIYALVNRDGWMVVKRYSDYDFPINIALRVIEPKLSTIETKALAGDKEASTETYNRTVYRLQAHELDTLWRVFKVFSSKFKKDSSIYTLQAFKEKKNISVLLGRSKLMINAQISFNLYPEILDHFSKIHWGKATYGVNGSEEDDDPSFKYLKNISPVDDATSVRLDEQLAKCLFEYFQRKRRDVVFRISHRYYRDYYASTWFTLHYKGCRVSSWSSPPSFDEIFTCLENFPSFGKEILESSGHVLGLLQQAHLKYSRGEKHRRDFPLIEFLTGEVRDSKTYQTFFRNDGIWLKVTADHLVTVQSAFYELLNDGVLTSRRIGSFPCWLNLPWIAKEKWASFILQDAEKRQIDLEEIEEVVGILKQRKYSFVDEKGRVLVPYLTACLLEGIKDRKLTKLLDKRWSELSEFLETNREKVVHATDLEHIFPSPKRLPNEANKNLPSQISTRSTGQLAFKIYHFLTEKRPICMELPAGHQANLGKVRIIDEQGNVLQTDLAGIDSKKTFERSRPVVEKYLKKCQQSGQLFKDEELRHRLSNITHSNGRKINIDHVLKVLKNPVSLQRKYAFKGRIIVRFLPSQRMMLKNGNLVSDKIWEFLKERHQAYKKVCKEEGYSRQYLGKPGYVVGDQVYAGNAEKVELFDVLFHDKVEGKLYLYHIKEQFGQPTREACAQIRLAAQMLAQDRTKGYPHLRSLHAKAINSQGKSAFQQNVKKQFQDLCPKAPNSAEGWIKLFDKDPKNIIFVYAFVDDGAKERRLEEEQDPKHIFIHEDFPGEDNRVIETLKEKKYLNKEGKLARKGITATQEKFKQDFKDVFKNWNLVFDRLKKYTSQFNSIGAKLELIHLRDHMRSQFSFGFQICQIDREGFFPEAPYQANDYEIDMDELRPDINLELFYEKPFYYEGKRFSVGKETTPFSNCIWHVLGYPTELSSYIKKFLFIQRLQLPSQNQIPELPTQEAKEDYKKTIWQGSFKKNDLTIAACVANKKCLIFKEIENDDGDLAIDATDPVGEYNKQASRTVCLVERSGGYSLCKGDGDQAMNFSSDLSLEEIDLKLLPHGIRNSGTDCFLNAALQLIIHTSLIELFQGKKNLLLDDKPGNYDYADSTQERTKKVKEEKQKREAMFCYLEKFLVEYVLRKQEELPCSSPIKLRQSISELNRANPDSLKNEHQDASEVFNLLRKCYCSSDYLSTLSKYMQPDRKKEKDITNTPEGRGSYSQISNDGRMPIREDTPFVLELPLSETNLSFEECLKSYLDDSGTITVKYCDPNTSKVLESQASSHIEKILPPKKGVLISYKRFDNQRNKISSKVSMNSLKVKIDSQDYFLKGFIVHKGESINSGHYVTYCLCPQGWLLFDDDKTVKKEKNIKTAVQDAYILFFEPDKNSSSRSIPAKMILNTLKDYSFNSESGNDQTADIEEKKDDSHETQVIKPKNNRVQAGFVHDTSLQLKDHFHVD